MFNRTDAMQHDAKQRIADRGTRTDTADNAPGVDGRNQPSVDKAEAMVALLANRIRRNETRT
jgi:hypothetical protein